MKEFAKQNGFDISDWGPWDASYWATKQEKSLFDMDDSIVRPYLPLPKVLGGLFNLVGRVFNVDIKKGDSNGKDVDNRKGFVSGRENEGYGFRSTSSNYNKSTNTFDQRFK